MASAGVLVDWGWMSVLGVINREAGLLGGCRGEEVGVWDEEDRSLFVGGQAVALLRDDRVVLDATHSLPCG